MKTEYIHDKLTTQLNLSICKNTNKILTFEEYSFLEITGNFFSVKPDQFDRAHYVMRNIMSDYRNLAASINFENVAIESVIFAMRESNLDCYLSADIDRFINLTYKLENRKAEKIQVWGLVQQIEGMFSEIETCISQTEEAKRPIWKVS